MKTKITTAIIAGIVFLISLILVFITQDYTIWNNIFVGIMGSSIVSFTLELSNFFSEMEKNKKTFLGTLFNIWVKMKQYIYNINHIIEDKNMIITKEIFVSYVNDICMLLDSLNYFDEVFYEEKENYKSFLKNISQISSEIRINQFKFESLVIEKKIELVQAHQQRNVLSSDISNQLLELKEKTQNKFELFQKEYLKVLSDKELKECTKMMENINKTIEKFQYTKTKEFI